MPSSPVRRTLLAVLALSAVLAPVALAQRAQGTNGTRETNIVPASPSTSGSSGNTTFSQDARLVRLMAFDSAATNLVPGDSNSKRDIFVLARGAREGDLSGRLSRVSVAGRAGQANGDSTKPSLDGDQKRSPHCATFQSSATNLDRADRSADSDVYLRDLRRRTTTLVSVGHRNATNGTVDGECEFITYQASGSVFVRDLEADRTSKVARGQNPDQQTNGKGVVYERGGQIYQQAYQKLFNKGNPIVKRTARELLVSAGAAGRGNGRSANPAADDNGYYVAFESTSTNLCTRLCQGVSEDANGSVSDIFRRTISRKAPTKDRMQMASFSWGVSDKYPQGVKEQGNGPSNNAAITGAGENILFDSMATNLRQSPGIKTIDPNGATRDVYYWNFPRARGFGNVSRESKPGSELSTAESFYDGPSTNASASNRANFVGFTSAQTGRSGEANGGSIEDVFIRFLGGAPIVDD